MSTIMDEMELEGDGDIREWFDMDPDIVGDKDASTSSTADKEITRSSSTADKENTSSTTDKENKVVLCDEKIRQLDAALVEEMIDDVKKEMFLRTPKGDRYVITFAPVELGDLAHASVQNLVEQHPNLAFFLKRQGKFKKKKGYAQVYFNMTSEVRGFIHQLFQVKFSELRTVVSISAIMDEGKRTAQMSFVFMSKHKNNLINLIKSKEDPLKPATLSSKVSFQIEKVQTQATPYILALMFPYASNVNFSSAQKQSDPSFKGPASVFYLNQRWMEAVLECCSDFKYGDLNLKLVLPEAVSKAREVIQQKTSKPETECPSPPKRQRINSSDSQMSGSDDDISNMTLDVCTGMMESLDKLKQMGTDNPNVLKILEDEVYAGPDNSNLEPIGDDHNKASSQNDENSKDSGQNSPSHKAYQAEPPVGTLSFLKSMISAMNRDPLQFKNTDDDGDSSSSGLLLSEKFKLEGKCGRRNRSRSSERSRSRDRIASPRRRSRSRTPRRTVLGNGIRGSRRRAHSRSPWRSRSRDRLCSDKRRNRSHTPDKKILGLNSYGLHRKTRSRSRGRSRSRNRTGSFRRRRSCSPKVTKSGNKLREARRRTRSRSHDRTMRGRRRYLSRRTRSRSPRKMGIRNQDSVGVLRERDKASLSERDVLDQGQTSSRSDTLKPQTSTESSSMPTVTGGETSQVQTEGQAAVNQATARQTKRKRKRRKKKSNFEKCMAAMWNKSIDRNTFHQSKSGNMDNEPESGGVNKNICPESTVNDMDIESISVGDDMDIDSESDSQPIDVSLVAQPQGIVGCGSQSVLNGSSGQPKEVDFVSKGPSTAIGFQAQRSSVAVGFRQPDPTSAAGMEMQRPSIAAGLRPPGMSLGTLFRPQSLLTGEGSGTNVPPLSVNIRQTQVVNSGSGLSVPSLGLGFNPQGYPMGVSMPPAIQRMPVLLPMQSQSVVNPASLIQQIALGAQIVHSVVRNVHINQSISSIGSNISEKTSIETANTHMVSGCGEDMGNARSSPNCAEDATEMRHKVESLQSMDVRSRSQALIAMDLESRNRLERLLSMDIQSRNKLEKLIEMNIKSQMELNKMSEDTQESNRNLDVEEEQSLQHKDKNLPFTPAKNEGSSQQQGSVKTDVSQRLENQAISQYSGASDKAVISGSSREFRPDVQALHHPSDQVDLNRQKKQHEHKSLQHKDKNDFSASKGCSPIQTSKTDSNQPMKKQPVSQKPLNPKVTWKGRPDSDTSKKDQAHGSEKEGNVIVSIVKSRTLQVSAKSKCPVKNCDFIGSLSSHALEKHLPAIYNFQNVSIYAFVGCIQVLLCALFKECVWDKGLEKLSELVRRFGLGNLNVKDETSSLCIRLCQYAGWRKPTRFTTKPFSCLGLLMQDDIALHLIARVLTAEEMHNFQQLETSTLCNFGRDMNLCVISNCRYEHNILADAEKHALSEHLPSVFSVVANGPPYSQQLLYEIAQCVLFLSNLAVGRYELDITIQKMQKHANSPQISQTSVFPRIMLLSRAVCKHMSWECPQVISTNPINCLVVLMQHNVAMQYVADLDENQQKIFRNWKPGDVASDHPVIEFCHDTETLVENSLKKRSLPTSKAEESQSKKPKLSGDNTDFNVQGNYSLAENKNDCENKEKHDSSAQINKSGTHTQQTIGSMVQNKSGGTSKIKQTTSNVCPIFACKGLSVNELDLESHACEVHLPEPYKWLMSGNKLGKQKIDQMIQCVYKLSKLCFNRKPLKQLEVNMIAYLNRIISRKTKETPQLIKISDRICEQAGWSKHLIIKERRFKNRFNSLAMLLQYDVALEVLSRLSTNAQTDFFLWGREKKLYVDPHSHIAASTCNDGPHKLKTDSKTTVAQPQMGSNTAPDPHTRSKGQAQVTCVFPLCRDKVSVHLLEEHSCKNHLPTPYRWVQDGRALDGETMDKMIDCVYKLCELCIGYVKRELCEVKMITYYDSKLRSNKVHVSARILQISDSICKRAGWEIRKPKDIRGFNSLALLLQYDIALSVLAGLPVAHQKKFQFWQWHPKKTLELKTNETFPAKPITDTTVQTKKGSCPISTCSYAGTTTGLENHACQCHLPFPYRWVQGGATLTNEVMNDMIDCVYKLCDLCIGSLQESKMISFVKKIIPQPIKVSKLVKNISDRLCKKAGWARPFGIGRFSSISLLLQYDVALEVLSSLTVKAQEDFAFWRLGSDILQVQSILKQTPDQEDNTECEVSLQSTARSNTHLRSSLRFKSQVQSIPESKCDLLATTEARTCLQTTLCCHIQPKTEPPFDVKPSYLSNSSFQPNTASTSGIQVTNAPKPSNTVLKFDVQLNSASKSNVPATIAPKPSLQIATPPKPTVQTTSGPKPSVQTAAAPKPSVRTSTASKPIVHTGTAPKPKVQTATAPKPSVQTTSGPKPSVQTATALKPSVQTATASKPIVQITIAPKPSVQTATASKPSVPIVQTATAPKPSVQITTASKLSVQFTAPKPSVQITTTASKPSVQTTTAPKHNVQIITAPKSSVQPTSAPKPNVQTVTAPEHSVHITTAPKPSVQITTAPKPSMKITTAPKPSVQTATAPKLSVQTVIALKPSVQTATALKPSVQATTALKPIVQTVIALKPSVQTVTALKASLRTATALKPSVQATTASKLIVKTTTAPKLNVQFTAPKPSVQIATTAPNPNVQITTAPKPSVKITTAPKPYVQTATAPKPSVQTATALKPSVQTTTAPEHSVQITVTLKPSVQVTTAPKPSVQTAAAPKPNVQTATAPKPSVQTATAPKPSVQITTAPKPSVQTAAEPKPSVQTATAPKLSVQTTNVPKPRVQTASASKPSVQLSTAPKPSIQPSTFPKSAVQPSTLSKPSVQPSAAPKPSVQPFTAPKPLMLCFSEEDEPSKVNAKLNLKRRRRNRNRSRRKRQRINRRLSKADNVSTDVSGTASSDDEFSEWSLL